MAKAGLMSHSAQKSLSRARKVDAEHIEIMIQLNEVKVPP